MLKSSLKIVFFVLLFVSIFLVSISFSYEDQYLPVGYPKNLKFKFPIGRVDVGDSSICNFHVDRKARRITLVPTKPGETRLLIYDRKDVQREAMKIFVTSKDLNRYIKDLKRLLRDVEGITLSQVETQVVIEGEVYLKEDIETINKVIKNVPFVVNLVKISRNAQRILAKKIEREIGSPEVVVEPHKGKMIIKGRVYSKKQEENAIKIANIYWDADKIVTVLDVQTVKAPPQRAKTIEVSLHYIELNKVLDKNFLFKWTPFPKAEATGQLLFNPQSGSTQFMGSVITSFSELIPKLNYMKSLGVVRVLENPTVSVKSGEEASLSSGTKLLIPVVQPGGARTFDVQDIGVDVTVTPIQFKNDIDIKIDVSISSLGSPTASGIINIDKNEISTRQFVKNGESIVVGGILRTSSTDIKDKQPEEQKDQPGLFTFFKSRDKSLARSQFIIFVTPKVVDFASEANKEIKDYFNIYEIYPLEK